MSSIAVLLLMHNMSLQLPATAWHRARPALTFGHLAPVFHGATPLRAAELHDGVR